MCAVNCPICERIKFCYFQTASLELFFFSKLREELGFRPLVGSNNNRNEKMSNEYSRSNSNVLTAMLLLVEELNVDELANVIQACQKRKCSLLNTEMS